MDRLSTYPYVVVRLRCRLCQRRGEYRLARLAARFGPEYPMASLVGTLAVNCPWRRGPGAPPPRKYEAWCGAYLPDLAGPTLPRDLPRAMGACAWSRAGVTRGARVVQPVHDGPARA